MSSFSELYLADIKRYGDYPIKWEKKFFYYFRKLQTSNNKLLLPFYRYMFFKIKEKHGVEISYKTQIGKGFYLGHPYNITINPKTTIGEYCSVHRGVLIGQENRGKRKGAPTIGNKVWIGINAVIVGNINIGDDVLIAPNSFVNCDIPSHSIVFGNPCVTKHKDNATEDYINIH